MNNAAEHAANDLLAEWIENFWRPGERIQTYALLERLGVHIEKTLSYQLRGNRLAPLPTFTKGGASYGGKRLGRSDDQGLFFFQGLRAARSSKTLNPRNGIGISLVNAIALNRSPISPGNVSNLT